MGEVDDEERLDGFRVAVVFVGDPGRLVNEFIIGVTGVLDGLSIGFVKLRMTCGKGVGDLSGDGDLCGEPTLKPVETGDKPLRPSLDDLLELLLMPVGTEGSWNAGVSSNSSIGGKVWVNSERLYCDDSGEDDGVEEGDGGPNDEGDTKE